MKTGRKNTGFGQWHKNKYEDEYLKSVYQSQHDWEHNSIFQKYLDMESTNERLLKLKHKFGDDTGSQHHLKSIYQSQTYQEVPRRKEMNPDFNLIRNVLSSNNRDKIMPRDQR
jgi:hypothetical protein